MEVESYQSKTDTIIDQLRRKTTDYESKTERDFVEKKKKELEIKLFEPKKSLVKLVENYSSLDIHEKTTPNQIKQMMKKEVNSLLNLILY